MRDVALFLAVAWAPIAALVAILMPWRLLVGSERRDALLFVLFWPVTMVCALAWEELRHWWVHRP